MSSVDGDFAWKWEMWGICAYIDVALFQSFHNMFVVDVALFQSFHNMFVVVIVTYPPPWGSPSSLGPSPSEGLRTNILFSHFTGDTNVERN